MEEQILDILCDICEDDIVCRDRSIDLIDSGLLDSLGRIEFIMEIENQIGVSLQPTEINWEDLNTPQKIVDHISKLAG